MMASQTDPMAIRVAARPDQVVLIEWKDNDRNTVEVWSVTREACAGGWLPKVTVEDRK